MNVELISEIFRSKESSSYQFYLDSRKIQDVYWRKFLDEYSRLSERNNKIREEEHNYFMLIKELIESEVFEHLIGNDKYLEKVNSIIQRDSLVIAESQTKLLSVYHELMAICTNYKNDFESFVKTVNNRINSENELASKNVILANVCRESFFNALCNNNLI